MQLALLIIAGLGALLFIVSFLAYVVSGFRHHFVTGLISLLPVLNVITLPSLWYKSSRKFIVGFIGLIIFIAAWFLGADKGIQGLVSSQSSTIYELTQSETKNTVDQNNLSNSNRASSLSTVIKSNRSSNLNEEDMLDLPTKALYRMAFDIVPVDQIANLQGRIVQITKTDSTQIEGRIKSVSPGSVVLEGLFENELPIASIKQLKLMVKKSNQ